MPREHSGDLYDFQNMSDAEIRDVIIDHLREQSNLDPDDFDVLVRSGSVTLTGRVGTDQEVQVASEVLDDLLGLEDFSNELVVDELRRGQQSEASDEATAAGAGGGGRDEPASQQSDTADHLVEDLESETYGTEDVGKAIRDASAYSPPDRPVSDGYGSREDH